MEKLLAMHVAAQLTQAACSSAGSGLPVSPDLADNGVRAKNLQVWETFRVFYRGVIGALADNTSWPAPELPTGKLLPNLLQSLTPLLGSGPVQELLQRLLDTPRPLPDPGAK